MCNGIGASSRTSADFLPETPQRLGARRGPSRELTLLTADRQLISTTTQRQRESVVYISLSINL
jgi:hypothetical protein